MGLLKPKFHETWQHKFRLADNETMENFAMCPVDISSNQNDYTSTWVGITSDNYICSFGSMTASQFAIKHDYGKNKIEFNVTPSELNRQNIRRQMNTRLPLMRPHGFKKRKGSKWKSYKEMKRICKKGGNYCMW